MTPQSLAELIIEAGPMALLQDDKEGNNAFHFLKYRRDGNGNERSARNDNDIATLILGVAEADASLTQVLLQQAAAHAYVAASRRLIEEHGGQLDAPSEFDARTPREIGKEAHDTATRDLFDDRDEVQQRALDEQRREFDDRHQRELLELFARQDEEKRVTLHRTRCDLFRQSVLSVEPAVEPWGLANGVLQAWLIEKAGDNNKGSLKTMLDAMGDVDGLSILADWVSVGFDGTKPNCGKLVTGRVKEHLGIEAKPATVTKLGSLLGQHPLGKMVLPNILKPGGLSFYKALLLSCEKRSLLTDYVWVRMLGVGAFGRAHLCTNRFSGERIVIKLMMPDSKGEFSDEFKLAVVETELQQKLGNSEFIASIYSWGTFGGAVLFIVASCLA